ncbi:insulinase family protein [bacterium]|nr:insulinase family protein [bacterium]
MKDNHSGNGFRFIEKEYIREIDSQCSHYEHDKSGAKLILIENEDDNMMMNVCFRTPPDDDTGLPHILEHSVLSGSKRFPTKEPLRDYMKKSLATFINAMTMSDATTYPYSSRNEKDFFNLMDVYLDAVFNPLIYEREEIFKQEGWHYELDDMDGPLRYNGIVFNEMKGAFSSPIRVMYPKIFKSLFPDSQYQYCSGGDPDKITDLSYQQFLDFHKKYYHPSNSVIVLYGKVSVEKCFKHINDNYLVNFEKKTIDSELNYQESFEKSIDVFSQYSVGKEDSVDDKSFISVNYVVGNALDPVNCLSLEILCELLIGSPASPLKKALIDAKIGKDVLGFCMTSAKQPFMSLMVKYADSSRLEEFKSIVNKVLSDIVENGFNSTSVKAEINSCEFRLRETGTSNYPKGLELSFMIFKSLMYDGHPFMYLKYEQYLDKIKKESENGLFEKMVKEMLLLNNHSSYVIMDPVRGLSAVKKLAVQKKLDKIKKGFSDEDLKKVHEETLALQKFHNTKSTPEQIDLIPSLILADVEPEVEKSALIKSNINDVTVLHNENFSNGITYLKLYFDMEPLEVELLPYVSLLTSVLGEVDTENKEFSNLTDEIKIKTGGMFFNTKNYRYRYDPDKFSSKFVVSVKFLKEKFSSLSDLLNEVLNHSVFRDPKRLKEIIREQISRYESVIPGGRFIESFRMKSYLSPSGRYQEVMKGLTFYRFLLDLEKESDISVLEKKFREVCDKVFNRDGLLVSVTSSKEDFKDLKIHLPGLLESFKCQKFENTSNDAPETGLNDGLIISSKVQYVLKGSNFRRCGYDFTGHLDVAKSILTMNYLIQKIRVQGGAYGAYILIGRSGDMILASYRDPELKKTIDVFDGAGAFLKEFKCSPKELNGFIIGTIGKLDRDLSPEAKGDMLTANFLCGITYDDRQRERTEVIQSSIEEVRDTAELFQKIIDDNLICVLGNDSIMHKNEKKFNKLIKVFN